MEADTKRYSPEGKTVVLAKLLSPYNMTVSSLAQQEGVSYATTYNLRNHARLDGKIGSRKPIKSLNKS
ncbi:transposase [Sodalis sp. RH18]